MLIPATGANANTGGLVGTNFFNAAKISNSYSTGAVVGGNIAGGLVGDNGEGAQIYGSYATGSVSSSSAGYSGSGSAIGGLVGLQDGGGTLDSYARGSVTGLSYVGGLIGEAGTGAVISSYATGTVTGGYPIGGFVGGGFAGFVNNNSYWDSLTSGLTNAVGFCVNSGCANGASGLTTAQFTSGLPSGFDPTIWGSNPSINNGYPYLLWQFPNGVPSSGLNSNTSGTPNLQPGWEQFVDPKQGNTTNTQTSGSSPLPNFEKINGQNVYVVPYPATTPPAGAGNGTGGTGLQVTNAGSIVLTLAAAYQYAEQYAAPIIAAKADETGGPNNGYIYPPETTENNQECAVLVQALAPVGLTSATSTQPGWTIAKDSSEHDINLAPDAQGNYPALTPGTPIATFKMGADGKYYYPADGILNPQATGLSQFAHAAIFVDYIKNPAGTIVGMYILDQYAPYTAPNGTTIPGQPAEITARYFNQETAKGVTYSVIATQ